MALVERIGDPFIYATVNAARQPPMPRFRASPPMLAQALQRGIEEAIAVEHLVLPNLEHQPCIAAVSDYAGDAPQHKHLTYSFLVSAFGSAPFVTEMQRLRAELPPEARTSEIAFKKLSFGPMRRLLPAYLKALDDHVFGLLCTVAIPKAAMGLLVPGAQSENAERVALAKLAMHLHLVGWKPEPLHRMARIAHIQAFLLALLTVPGQRVVWMTDADAIAANDQKFRQTTAVLRSLLSDLYGVDHFLRFGVATPLGNDQFALRDSLSATDLAAGAVAQDLAGQPVNDAHREILRWLSKPGHALNKVTLQLVPREGGVTVSVKAFREEPRDQPSEPGQAVPLPSTAAR